MSQNLKFTLFVKDSQFSLGHSLMARVFDFQSLMAVHRAIQVGAFGHFSKKRYYLVPLAEVRVAHSQMEYDSERPYCSLERKFQLYPSGGQALSPSLLELFVSSQTF